MNKPFWESYYKKKEEIKYPSDFAKFCNGIIKPNSKIIELGCGNGRDSYYFGKQGHEVIGIDYAIKSIDVNNNHFVKKDVIKFLKEYKTPYDIIYARFFLHAMPMFKVKKIIDLSYGIFMAEARSINDISFKDDHKRYLIDGNKLLEYFIKNKYKILYFKEGKDMAIYKDQNPTIIRIIAERKKYEHL